MLGRIKTALRPGFGDHESLVEEIEALSSENRVDRDPERERELLKLRQRAGLALTGERGERAGLVEPAYEQLPEGSGIPEVQGGDVTPELIRAAILRHGSLLVRGLVDADDAGRLAEEVDRAFAAREEFEAGRPPEDGYYEEIQPEGPFAPIEDRIFLTAAGAVLVADSPRLTFDVTELLDQADLRGVIAGYLGETPAFSAHKTTVRKVLPTVSGAWHQDGKFLGDVNSLNLWLALSHCGDTAPGMDLVPRRLDHIVEAGTGPPPFQAIEVTQEAAEELAGEEGIQRPIFDPGDAMFFDHLFLHSTASDPEMPNPRFALESWFFGPSAFPDGYIPLAY